MVLFHFVIRPDHLKVRVHSSYFVMAIVLNLKITKAIIRELGLIHCYLQLVSFSPKLPDNTGHVIPIIEH